MADREILAAARDIGDDTAPTDARAHFYQQIP
jgi:hypothetical protein